MKIKRRLPPLCASLLYVLAAGHPVLAEDIEVLIGPGGVPRMQPNVLFIMDTSDSMKKNIDGTEDPATTSPTRMSILKDVFRDLMENRYYQGINVAMMRFSSEVRGGYFVYPMQKLNNNIRNEIIGVSRRLSSYGTTPLSETLYEAARFWGGEGVGFEPPSSQPRNHPDVTGPDGNYITPISSSECQKNYNILLTDGGPWDDTDADEDIENNLLNGGTCDGSGVNKAGDGRCLDDVARYLNTIDQNSEIPGTQTVQTYVISFATTQGESQTEGEKENQKALRQTADVGGGKYIYAANKEKLEAAFTSVLKAISNANDNFSPPALAVNTFNGISHVNRLYYALFEPTATPKWNGNIKPYQLDDTYQLVDAETPPRPVVDGRGLFLEESRSFWSSTDDGGNIVIGSVNDRLPAPGDRNLYTYTGDYNDDEKNPTLNAPIITTNNALKNTSDSELTADMLNINISDDHHKKNDGKDDDDDKKDDDDDRKDDKKDDKKTDDEFTQVLDTIRSAKLGAPLHSQPILITYSGDNESNAIRTLFVATNDGFLHALNASPKAESTAEGGKELFAFIPKELLPNLPKLHSKTGSVVYGLDGDISAWIKESNDDPDINIDADDGDHVYIYVGMRRGGSNYYALDVTTRTAPILKWVIRGGPDGTPGFEELGQTWSKPTLASIKYGDSTKKVLVFGGGYDVAQDNHSFNTGDSIGRAIFIVDADTGELLWWAGPTDSDADLKLEKMTHSIPSDIQLLDSDRDGLTDRLYVGDMRGQIFRIDLDAKLSASKGILLARLSGDTEADNRRFYYPPDVVFTQPRNATPYISINIGSGYRAHPLNPLRNNGTAAERVNDRFYSLRDPYVTGPIPVDATFTLISDGSDGGSGNLFDATNNLVTGENDIKTLAGSTGWYITLGNGNGEKVLAPSITINGEIFFTTYTPPKSVETSNCAPPPGVGHLYRVSLFDATPTRTKTNHEPLTAPTIENRFTLVKRPGIPPGPTVMFRKNKKDNVEIVTCINTECEGVSNPDPIQETYWLDGT